MTSSPTPPVGRELDAAVAEKVMGWTLKPDGTLTPPRGKAPVDTDVAVPPYSRDMRWAWQVVEWMGEMVDKCFGVLPDEEGWVAGWGGNASGPWSEIMLYGGSPPQGEYGWVVAPTAPEAICRAALAALEGDTS